MRIFDEEGNELGLFDIAKHFIDTYPDDIFITGPYPIHKIRDLFKKLLEIHEANLKLKNEIPVYTGDYKVVMDKITGVKNYLKKEHPEPQRKVKNADSYRDKVLTVKPSKQDSELQKAREFAEKIIKKLGREELKIWSTKCDVELENKGVALDCPEDGIFYECPKCKYRIVIFKQERETEVSRS